MNFYIFICYVTTLSSLKVRCISSVPVGSFLALSLTLYPERSLLFDLYQYRLALPLLQWNHKVCILLHLAYFSQYYVCESSMLHETVAPSVQCFTACHCLYVIQCIYSTLDGHLKCFQFWAMYRESYVQYCTSPLVDLSTHFIGCEWSYAN